MQLDLINNSIDKKSLENISEALLIKVMDGDLNPLELNIRAKALIKCLEDAIKKTEKFAVEEAEKYGKGSELLGVKFSISESGNRLDYDSDSEYYSIKEKLKKREEV